MKRYFILLVMMNQLLFVHSNNLELSYSKNLINFTITPGITFGTHANGIGVNLNFILKKNYEVINKIITPEVELFIYPYWYLSNLGIPNESFEFNFGFQSSITLGELIKHKFSYYLSYYLTTSNTSQPYGGISYNLIAKNFFINLSLDNDDAYLIATDKYRTTKGVIKYIDTTYKNRGVGLTFLLWTGNLDGTIIDNNEEMRHKSYQLTGYGSEYSHGIISIDLFYDIIKLSIGYDSEIIRDKIQNGWHYFYNRPRVPLIDRDDRFYFQVEFFPRLNRY